MFRFIIFVISVVLVGMYGRVHSQTGSENRYRVVCYHTNWAQYRDDAVEFTPEDIDPFLCTHIIYSFAQIDSNLLLAPYEWNDESTEWSTGNYEKFTNLKKKNPALKTLLAVGGWNHGVAPFSDMVASSSTRQAFISHAIHYLRNRNFDGLDLDWEFPASRGSPSSDRQKFTILCQELKAAFEAEAESSEKPRLLLTAAVSAGYGIIDAGYDILAVSSALDFLNLMAYDLRGSWEDEQVTGHHTALYPGGNENSGYSKLNIEYAVNKWLDGDCPPKKLNMGFGAYGRAFTLAGSNTDIGAPTTTPAPAGLYTQEAGFLAYYEICQKLRDGDLQYEFDEFRQVPYAYGNTEWVGYDDADSIIAKTDFIKSYGLGGGMVWALDLDDFTGHFCAEGPWPFIRTLNESLNGVYTEPADDEHDHEHDHGENDEQDVLTIVPSVVGGTDEETGVHDDIDMEGEFSCKGRADGIYDDPRDCISYYECWGNGKYIAKTSCVNDLVFNPIYSYCDWPANYECSTESLNSNPTSLSTPTNSINPDPTVTFNPTDNDFDFSCQGRADGIYDDPSDCFSYYECWGNGQYIEKTSCVNDLVFNHIYSYCDSPANYQCSTQSPDSNPTTLPTPTNSINPDPTVTFNPTDNDFDFSCEGRADGIYDDPSDCISYYECWGNGQYIEKTSCVNDLVFNHIYSYCDSPANYQCSTQSPDSNPTTLPTPTNSINPDPAVTFNPTDNDLDFSCEGQPDGIYDDPSDCISYYECWGNGQYIAKTSCVNDLVFNPIYSYCDWPANYECSTESLGLNPTTLPTPTNSINPGPTVTINPTDNDLNFSCEGRPDGTYADPNNCFGFIQCYGDGQYITKTPCQPGLVFNPSCLCCDWSYNYDCPETK